MAPSLNLPIQKLNSYWQINLLRFRVDSKDFLIIIRTPLNSYHFTLSLVYRFSEKLIKNTTNKSNQLIISTEQFERLIFSQKLVGFFKIYMQVVVYSRLFLMYCFKWWKTVMALNSEGRVPLHFRGISGHLDHMRTKNANISWTELLMPKTDQNYW